MYGTSIPSTPAYGTTQPVPRPTTGLDPFDRFRLYGIPSMYVGGAATLPTLDPTMAAMQQAVEELITQRVNAAVAAVRAEEAKKRQTLLMAGGGIVLLTLLLK